MALEAALLELRSRLKRLAGLLAVLRKRVSDDCPDESHYLYGRIHDAVPVAEGWLRKARKAAKAGIEAVGHGDLTTVRTALAKGDLAFEKLRAELLRELTGRTRCDDLADLGRRKQKAWGPWVAEVLPAVADIRRAAADAMRTVARCWRELAVHPSPTVVVKNVVVGKQVAGRSRRGRQAHNVED